MNRFVLIPIFASLSACGDLAMPDFRNLGGSSAEPVMAAPAPVVPLTARERLIVATEAQGCKINVDTVTIIMANANLNQNDLAQAVQQLESEGLAGIAGEGEVQLKTPNCTT